MSLRSGLLLGLLVLIFLGIGCSSVSELPVGEPQDVIYIQHGRELVKGLAACGFCHGEKPSPDSLLSGGRHQFDQYGEVAAANLTPSKSGIKDWTTAELVRAVRSSIGKEDRPLSKPVHNGFEWISDEDLLAIIAYLRSQPPIENQIERRDISFLERNTTGFFESRREMAGYVPVIEPRFQAEYGEYLTDHVARCLQCHNSPGGLITSEEYLSGGATIKTDSGDKLAPGIKNSQVEGIGSWSEDDIVRYLKFGLTPENRQTDVLFCPTGFYRNASLADLRAIAIYLKSLK